MEERTTPAPLPADLPERWTENQIISPNGTEAGLSEQHGYNYLMRQVNLAQQGVNQLTGLADPTAEKQTPVNADSVVLTDSAAGGARKRLTWASLIAGVKGALNSVYAAIGHTHTPAQVGLGNVPNVATNDQTPGYTPATALAGLTSGEKLSLTLGKLAKAVSDLMAHLGNRSNPHGVTAAQAGLGSVPNVATNDQTPSYTPATALAGLTSGEKLGVAFGKLAKAVADLIAHIGNKGNPHGVTAAQAGLGNVPNVTTNNQTPTFTAASALSGLTSGEKLSVALGKLAKAVTDLMAHMGNKSNPHGVTAAQAGLGNVPNVGTNDQKPTYTAASALSGLASGETLATAFGKLSKAVADLIAHLGNRSNPHGVTAAQAGLGNVPNVTTNDQTPSFTAAGTRANLTSGEKLSLIFGKLAKWYADLKTVAWTGSYNDLSNKPAIPTTLPPSGTAGGDLSGSYPNPAVKDDSHAHTELAVKPDNFKDGAALPSTYPRGTTVFFSNNPANKFNGLSYCTVNTMKGYSNMVCVQYLYPYNIDAPITYRYGTYGADGWTEWRMLSVDGHTHAWGGITGKPSSFPPAGHAHAPAGVGLGNVPNVATNDQTPSYTAAPTLTGLTSGEKLTLALGKLSKAVTDLIAHIGNKSNPHGVTAAQAGAVPTGRTVNGKALSANVVLGAADVKTAAGLTMEAALGQKATAMITLTSGSVNAVVPMSTCGFIATPDVTDLPFSAWWIGDVTTTGTITRIDATNVHNSQQIYRRIYQNGTWYPWVALATATPVTEMKLPLASGFVATVGRKCCYSKAQNNLMVVHVSMGHTSGSIPLGDHACATLPVGYRPTEYTGTDGLAVGPDGVVVCSQRESVVKIARTITFYTK